VDIGWHTFIVSIRPGAWGDSEPVYSSSIVTVARGMFLYALGRGVILNRAARTQPHEAARFYTPWGVG